MGNYARAFTIGYTLLDASKTFIGKSDAKKTLLRNHFWGDMHPEYTMQSGLTVFDTKPGWEDYRARINEQLFDDPNSLNLKIHEDVKLGGPRQDHVFTNGAWVCETRFDIYQGGDDSGPYKQEMDLDGVNFDITYYVVLYDYHAEPEDA